MIKRIITNTAAASFLFAALILTSGLIAQTPSPSPASGAAASSDYTITSSVETGFRYRDVSGNLNKYRSDLNYDTGFRLFDSSFYVEDHTGKSFFDKALFMGSGWGADPSGMFRTSMEKAGAFRFDANVRKVDYYNYLVNHVNPTNAAFGEHFADTVHNFGDFDVVGFPESEVFRFKVGYSYNRTDGPGGFTHRAYSDEFGVKSDIDNGADDLRLGVEGRIYGFNMGLDYGHRWFSDNTRYFIDALNLGNNPTNNPRLFTFDRDNPIEGSTDYVNVRLQRTFAERFDLTARAIYSLTDTSFHATENATGRDNSNNFVDQDLFNITGGARRPQVRADIGVTYMVTSKFRISNTFTFDDFDITGSNDSLENRVTRSAAGAAQAPFNERIVSWRSTNYQRISNLIEGDYQFGPRFGFHLGYRYTNRDVLLKGYDQNFRTNAITPTEEDASNSTNAFIAGFKAKPMKNWAIYGDIETGSADNVFTRLANYDYTNYRIRSVATFGNLVWNVSAIAKNNENPAQSIIDPTRNVINDVSSRTFSTNVDWSPTQAFQLSGGYNYQYLTSLSDILVPLGVTTPPFGPYTPGVSEFYIRDSYYYVDASYVMKRVSFYGSWRFDDDNGQGSRATPPFNSSNIITSYPMGMHSPEFRVSVKLCRNIDWNFGYQYYKYRDDMAPSQNYSAHLPYTSLRFYFGTSADR